MFWGCELHMQPGHPSLFSNWRVMFVVALPPTPSPPSQCSNHCLGFAQPIWPAKQRWAGICRGKAGAVYCLQNEGKNPKITVKVEARSSPGGRQDPPRGWLEHFRAQSDQWAVLGCWVLHWLVWQLFLNWKLTVTADWPDNNWELLQRTDHCRLQNRTQLYWVLAH